MIKNSKSGMFAALKQQMEDNVSNATDADNSDIAQEEIQEISNEAETESKLRSSVDKKGRESNTLPAINDSSNSGNKRFQSAAAQQLTRKTFALPMVVDLAIKDLKYKRNLDQKINGRNTAKVTEDDIVSEALFYFFKQKGDCANAFESAEMKLQLLTN